jgi:hypothetical protein
MIVKFDEQKDEIFYIDATGNGVCLNWWIYTRDHIGESSDKYYKKLIFRKVNF